MYSWVIPLKDKNGITITQVFQKILDEAERKTNKIWVDKGSKLFKTSLNSWIETNNIEMYSMHNEGKSVVTERFIRTLKNQIWKYMTSVSKNLYIDKLRHIVEKCNKTFHRTIKMKPVDVRSKTYINVSKENNYK